MGTVIATGVLDLSHDTIISWISTRRADSAQYRSIAKSALHTHYGKHTEQEDNYVDFVVDKLLDKAAGEAGITRENLRSNIIMRGLPGQNLLLWDEHRSYTLICPSMQGTHPLYVDLYFRSDPENLQTLLSHIRQEVLIDRIVVFDFAKWFEAVNKKTPHAGETVPGPSGVGGSLSFDGKWVTFTYQAEIPLTKLRTDVEIVETSYLLQAERSYTLRVSQPTHRLDFSLTLADHLDGWSLRPPTLSAAEYDPTARSQLFGRRASASAQGWVLPGVVLAVEWTAPDAPVQGAPTT
jgi:hypothetical protein